MGSNGRVAIDSEERDICSRWRSRRDMVVFCYFVVDVDFVWISRR